MAVVHAPSDAGTRADPVTDHDRQPLLTASSDAPPEGHTMTTLSAAPVVTWRIQRRRRLPLFRRTGRVVATFTISKDA